MYIKENHNFIPFKKKVWLASPTMHPESKQYMNEAFDTNWMSTVGANINEVERQMAEKVGCGYAVALSSGTAALHLAVRLAGCGAGGQTGGTCKDAESGEDSRYAGNGYVGIGYTGYGAGSSRGGVLAGQRVFCSDMTFDATINPVLYEGGIPVFIDTEYDTWNMDPVALERAFEICPEVRLIVVAHLYGTPGKIDEIREIADRHGAVIIEDAAESLGAKYKSDYLPKHETDAPEIYADSTGTLRKNGVTTWLQTGNFGDYNCISFNGNKIITGSSGGMFLTNSREDADKVRKWSTQSRENAPWYQHEELGYNYRMSNVIAGVVRGQIPYLEEHIAQKKAIYERYREAFADAKLPVHMNPYDAEKSEPNFWLSCMMIDEDAMCKTVRGECEALYIKEHGKTCPTEILEAISSINAEGRPIWKPMHMQPIYRMNPFITREGDGRAKTNAYIAGGSKGANGKPLDVGMDIFHRGLCLPSDNKMTAEQQEKIIEVIKACFE